MFSMGITAYSDSPLSTIFSAPLNVSAGMVVMDSSKNDLAALSPYAPLDPGNDTRVIGAAPVQRFAMLLM